MSATPSAPVAGLALLPCPFCGGEPRPHAHAGNVWVECESCCAKTAKAYKSFAKANSYWNRRAANRASAYDAMLAALYECEAYLTDREDVVDGSYGEPAPNREMSLLIEVSAAIKAAEGVKPL